MTDSTATYRADPSETPKGAVVILQTGSDAQTRKIADGFAQRGYVAIASAPSGLDEVQAVVDEAGKSGKVAVVGYGSGADLAYQAANRVTGLACAVGYYGTATVTDRSGKRKIPTLMHYGENDSLIPAEDIVQFRASRPDVSVFGYPAGHDFDCDERETYDAESARQASERTLFWVSQFVEGQAPIALKNAGIYAAAKPDKKKKKASSDDLGPPMD